MARRISAVVSSAQSPVLRSYVSVISSRRPALVAGVALALVQSVLLLPMPIIVRRAFDHAIPQNNQGELFTLSCAVVGLSLLSGLATMFSQRLVQLVCKQATESLRQQVVGRVFAIDLPSMDHLDPEEVHERLIGEPVRIESAATTIVRQVVPAIALIGGLTAVLVSIDPLLTLTVGLSVPVLLAISRATRPAVQQVLLETQAAFEQLGRHALTVFRAQLLLRGRGIDSDEYAKICARIADSRRLSGERSNRLAARAMLQATGLSLATAVTLWVGGNAVMSNRISTGSLLSFFAGVALIRAPSGTLASIGPILLEGRLSMERLDRFLTTSIVKRTDDRGKKTLTRVTSITLGGVSYAYNRTEGAIALENFDLSVTPGQVTALSGPNGSGKTTVLMLLLGLINPCSGSVRANGLPLSDLDASRYRQGLGVLFQNSFFLPGTLRENLTSGVSNVSTKQLESALADAEAAAVVAKMPFGLDTEMTEDFDCLSGGERQRLALARALLGRPGVIVLDEPSNHLPVAVVLRVVDRIRCWPENSAVLLISHDPALLAVADQHVGIGQSSHTIESRIA